MKCLLVFVLRDKCHCLLAWFFLSLALSSAELLLPAAFSQGPIAVRIDELIHQRAGGTLSPLASDEAFLRRIYLDLVGRIPTLAETQEFLTRRSPQRRAQVVDALLASDEYPLRMAQLFDVMLNERRGGHVEWRGFLRQAFKENRPWDRITREILNPDVTQNISRGAAFFYTGRLKRYGQVPADVPGLVRDIGRMFLGVDVQCAQCHDHLFIDDYAQVDYQGLLAFVGNTYIRTDHPFPAVAEKQLTEKVQFASVFDGEQKKTGPRLPGGVEFDVPTFEPGEEFLVPPDKKKKTLGVRKFSTLRILAAELPRSDNRGFARNIVNRLWWVMMGRGLVDPLDLHHPDNPPSHPELLETLTDAMIAHQFDIKWFLRELALSGTYQRSSQLPGGFSAGQILLPQSYRVALERPLSAEQLLQSTLTATGVERSWSIDPTGAKAGQDQSVIAAKEEQQQEWTKLFQAAFANPPKEPEIEIAPSVRAALFLMNDTTFLSWFESRPGNLVHRLAALDGDRLVAEELYLTVLTRRPSTDEILEVHTYLAEDPAERTKRLGHLAWALVTSTEFCVNH